MSETATAPNEPSLMEIDFMVKSKLEKAGIVFCAPSDMKITLENGVDYFQNELLKHDKGAILLFSHYCIIPMCRSFLGADMLEPLKKSPELVTYAVATAGYMQAEQNINQLWRMNPEWYDLQKRVPKVFTGEELQQIMSVLKQLLSDFPREVEKTAKWLIEDIAPKKEQMDAIKDFVKMMAEAPRPLDASEQLKTIGKNLLDICMPGVHGSHNLWQNIEKEKLMMYTPEKKLWLLIAKILLYLDVICYSQYLPSNLPDNPKDIFFKQLPQVCVFD